MCNVKVFSRKEVENNLEEFYKELSGQVLKAFSLIKGEEFIWIDEENNYREYEEVLAEAVFLDPYEPSFKTEDFVFIFGEENDSLKYKLFSNDTGLYEIESILASRESVAGRVCLK